MGTVKQFCVDMWVWRPHRHTSYEKEVYMSLVVVETEKSTVAPNLLLSYKSLLILIVFKVEPRLA